MTPYICLRNKKERALRACYAVAIANRWMGTPQTTHNGLTAQLFNIFTMLVNIYLKITHDS